MKYIAAAILLLSLPQLVSAQESTVKEKKVVQLSGNTITDSLEAVPYAHIIFLNKNLATASDIHGYFNFPVEENDSILFTAIGFKRFTLIVKDTFNVPYPYMQIPLEQDTIQLRELVIMPWQGNYERFKQAVLAFKPPMTDLDRAYKNLAIMDLYSLLYDSPATPTTAFRTTMQNYNDKLYWAGQLPPVNITNPIAWAQFFKALKDGDFKRKK